MNDKSCGDTDVGAIYNHLAALMIRKNREKRTFERTSLKGRTKGRGTYGRTFELAGTTATRTKREDDNGLSIKRNFQFSRHTPSFHPRPS